MLYLRLNACHELNEKMMEFIEQYIIVFQLRIVTFHYVALY